MYSQMMEVYLPSHDRIAMTMADAVRAFIRNLLWEDSVEMSMYQITLIKADAKQNKAPHRRDGPEMSRYLARSFLSSRCQCPRCRWRWASRTSCRR